MKTNQQITLRPNRSLSIAAVVLLAGLAFGAAIAGDEQRRIVAMASAEAEAGDQAPRPPAARDEVIIRAIEPERGKQAVKEMTWLGVSVEEVSEALAAQLGLKFGEGLVVNYVSTDSPAAKVELKKNDVLVEFEGQMLVDPIQLRKLVQMHPDGDSVKITFFRSGKKQSVTAKLVKKTWNESYLNMDEGSLQDGMRKLQFQLRGLNGRDGLGGQMNVLAQSLGRAGLDKEKMNIEVERTMEQTRKAIQDAMRHSQDGQDSHKVLGLASKELAELAGGGVDLGKNATIIIKSDGKSARTIVKTDDSGSYVIFADPGKHLTAHDTDGKLLFDGAIESPEQQQKVPKEVWEKIRPLLEQMDKGKIEIEQPALQIDTPEKQEP